MPYLKNALFLVAFICSLIVTSLAQTSEAGIFVTVKDQFGGAVSGAEITLGKADGNEKQIKTNNLGIAQFPRLSAGEYRIIVSATGFKEYVTDGVIVKNK